MEDKHLSKPPLTEAQWQDLMDNYKNSSLSQQSFCRQQGIDFNAFKNSRSRIAYRKKQSLLKSASIPGNKSFSEIKIATAPAGSKKLRITHPNGIECLVPTSLSATEMLAILGGLKSC